MATVTATPSLVGDLQLEGSVEEVPADTLSDLDLEATLSASNASPVVSLVDRILVQALERSASDIHLEPQDDGLVIRLRQDGVLEQLDKLPKKQGLAAVALICNRLQSDDYQLAAFRRRLSDRL